MNRAVRRAAAIVAVSSLALAAPGAALAQEGTVAPPSSPTAGVSLGSAVPLHAAVSPARPDPNLGDPLTYRGWIVVDPWVGVRWNAPDRAGDQVWGPVRTGRARLRSRLGTGTPWPADSVWVESPLQIFAVGKFAIPGLGFRLESGSQVVRSGNLPLVRVRVQPLIAADDSSASLRPARGPLPAPWWERVPWLLLVGAVLAFAGVVHLVMRLRRKKTVAPVFARAVAKRRDPGADALAELASLRRRALPQQGHFAEHAFLLGRILRRYLEATVHVPRPGDTSPELVRHLETGGFAGEELQRLTGLLRRWDGIKFARLESDAEEAERCEESVRELVVRRTRGQRQEVA